jgi:hypothetical protein
MPLDQHRHDPTGERKIKGFEGFFLSSKIDENGWVSSPSV